MCVMLGGRVAEEIIFDSTSTGARDDLERVTSLAYDQVARLGFNTTIGNMSFKPPRGEFPEERVYSQKTAQVIDDEVRQLVKMVLPCSEFLLCIGVHSSQHINLGEGTDRRALAKE